MAEQQNLLVTPVLKTVFVDEIPKDLFLLKTNASALPEYTDLNPSKQEYFAIEKTVFYGLQKSNALINMKDDLPDKAIFKEMGLDNIDPHKVFEQFIKSFKIKPVNG